MLSKTLLATSLAAFSLTSSAAVGVCDSRPVFDFADFKYKTCTTEGSLAYVGPEFSNGCQPLNVGTDSTICNTKPEVCTLDEPGCETAVCGFDFEDIPNGQISCVDSNECKNIDDEMCDLVMKKAKTLFTLAGMGCKTSIWDLFQEAISMGVIKEEDLAEDDDEGDDAATDGGVDGLDPEVKELLKNTRLGDVCTLECKLCDEEIGMTVSVPADDASGDDAASLGKKFVAVVCYLKGFVKTPVDGTNGYDLEYEVDFENCPFKAEVADPSRRLQDADFVTFSVVADNNAMNELEQDLSKEDSVINEVGGGLLPNLVGANATATIVVKKDIAEPGLGIIGIIALAVAVLLLLCCCCCVCCCRYVCKCCCRCGMDKKPKGSATQDQVSGVEMR